jgi:hypothetical protein
MTTTPTGQPGLRITCTNPTHNHRGTAAIMRDPGATLTQTRICKLIDAAYHPLAMAASVQRHGPWPTA